MPRTRARGISPKLLTRLAGFVALIEQVIYFVLGCVVTALAALAFAPLFWHRALRLTRARLQLQVPLSMQEILAERDQLRAEFAVERLKLEQAMDRIRASKTRDMAAIGRQRVAATAAADEIAALRQLETSQRDEIRSLMDDLAAANSEAGALQVEVHDAHGLVERWRAQADRDAGARGALRTELDDKRMLAVALETRLAGLETRLHEAHRAGESREQSLRGRLEVAMAQSARHETSGISSRRDLEEARQRTRTLEHELETARAARASAASPVHGLPNGNAHELARTHDGEAIDELRAENAALKDALAELRCVDQAGDAGLRASIHALGLAVAKMKRTDAEVLASGRERTREERASPIDAA